jgi:serine phosphatase RsbU (regulator of sigma subunit)
MRKFYFIIFFVAAVISKGQISRADSIQSALLNAKQDTNKVILLNRLGVILRNIGNSSKIEACLTEAEQLAVKLNYKKGEADALCEMGLFHELQGNYFEALDKQFKSLKLREAINDKSGISYSIHYIGDIYFSQSELSDKPTSKADYNKKALAQYFKSLKVAEEIGDKRSIANNYNCLGNSFRENKDFVQSLNYYLKAVKNRREVGDSMYISQTYTNIGKLYLQHNEYDEAFPYLFQALTLAATYDFKRTLVKTLGTIGNIYLKKKEYTKALDYCNKSLKLSKEIGFLEYIAKANSSISDIYGAPDYSGHNGDKALKYYKDFVQQRDSINTKKANQIDLQFEFEKKESLTKAEQDKKDVIASEELKQQKTQRNYSIIGLGLVLLFSAFIYRGYKQKQKINLVIAKQKKHIEEKQQEILDSISYAKRLQEAILPPKEFVSKYAPNNFILYKPKDIVAGDFYWAEFINGKFYIAAADSTGHGVPGAMVSVVCSNALNRTVKEFKETETGKILDKTRDLVIETFEKSESEVKDGMDISLLCIDFINTTITWSGANNPLWYIENKELKEIKADKQPIGKTDNPKQFTTHNIEFRTNTTFYLFTDGFADQFGGPKGKKYKYKQFSDLLMTNHNLELNMQLENANKSFDSWKGDLEQVDDVCVIGIKI